MATTQLCSRRPAAAEEDPAKLRIPLAGDEVAEEKPRRTKRVAALDIFRGLTVAMMILVDGAGDEWPAIGHAPWNGCNLADFVMPFFLFIVGMAIPLSLKVRFGSRSKFCDLSQHSDDQRMPNRLLAVRRVLWRTIKLIFWGLILQGGYSHAPDQLTYGVDMKHIRWCGILQRIALAYLVVALLEILTKKAQVQEQSTSRWSISDCEKSFVHFKNYRMFGACVIVIYLATIYATYVPDWKFTVHNILSMDYGKEFTVVCGVSGRLNPPCNAVGYIDRQVLGTNHMYQHPAWKRSKDCTYSSPYEGPFRKDAPSWCLAPFEPEGILSSIDSIMSTIIGVHFGHVLLHMKTHLERLYQWVLMGFGLLILGILLHFTHAIPFNKQLYSFSYVCLTAGAAGIVFSTFYILVDILDVHKIFLPLEWIGMNAMLVFVMAAAGIFEGFLNGWYYENPNNTLVFWVQKHIFIRVWHSRRVGILLYVIFAQILFWGLVAGILHRLGIYWKL
ncbi:heparan-alpha-glucosaminide N-acetyltransferase [Apostasia shenzhenica]|uniref:Heparan-alpha-glucosaminide N-acetyltransferase n=1 Tax=Apostasia shenzhenica TaxID=1088818 RepID=A0A2I0ASB5_9ASPA|nr:heparan-alpha-glucosaminide N-acetyltransferase [Apostasia shenzhenica]